jgi:hypothetical protein
VDEVLATDSDDDELAVAGADDAEFPEHPARHATASMAVNSVRSFISITSRPFDRTTRHVCA